MNDRFIRLELTLAGIGIYVAMLVILDDPFSFAHFFLPFALFLAAAIYALPKVVGRRSRRKLVATSLILGISMGLFFASYFATHYSGFPAQVYQYSTEVTCRNIQIPNSTSPSGYTNGSQCTTSITYTLNVYTILAIASDYIFWIPVVGLIIYSIPVWRSSDSLLHKISRNLACSAIGGALLLQTIGLSTSDTYPPQFGGWIPLDPYFAYQTQASMLCNSTNAFMGCVYVNPFFLVIDFLFWLGIVSLISLVANELLSSLLKGWRTANEPRLYIAGV